MNHIMKNAPMNATENFATYTMPDLPLFEGLVNKISDFILKNMRLKSDDNLGNIFL